MSSNDALLHRFPNVHVMPNTPFIQSLNVTLRNRETSRSDFIFTADQLLRFLCEEAISHVPYQEKTVVTPTDKPFHGLEFSKPVCGVSILRSGETMEVALRSVVRGVKIGKILIQRDETQAHKPARLFYAKLPADIQNHHVLLLDPMLATGGSAVAAVKVLLEHGVRQNDITFVNLISCPEGLETLFKAFSDVIVVTGAIDERLNEHKYIVPGIGDFGDRYFGT